MDHHAMNDEAEARAMIEALQEAVARVCTDHGLRMASPVEVDIEQRWDRHAAQLTVRALISHVP